MGGNSEGGQFWVNQSSELPTSIMHVVLDVNLEIMISGLALTEVFTVVVEWIKSSNRGFYFCSTRKRFTLLLLFLQHKDFIPGTQTKQRQWTLWWLALCVLKPERVLKETDLLQMFCVLVEIDSTKCLLSLLSMNSIFVHSQGSSCPENILNLKS